MIVVRTAADLRRVLGPRQPGVRRGFVPTMGALHDGHVALMARARADSSVVVASIFVNPRQFNDARDLAVYPRDEARDSSMAEAAGVDVLFVPSVDEMYPAGMATTIEIAGSALGFEGAERPGHFNGVALVCLKLFVMVGADAVYLGQKDAQQVAVLQQLVRDTNLDVDLVVVPTAREPDGLARSSRNVRLSVEERARAAAIPKALVAGLGAHASGRDAIAATRAVLDAARLPVDYVGVAAFDEPTLVVAVRAGATRLIDNVPLAHPDRAGLSGEAGGGGTR
jgi:pantoate--beta-alanine ligase